MPIRNSAVPASSGYPLPMATIRRTPNDAGGFVACGNRPKADTGVYTPVYTAL